MEIRFKTKTALLIGHPSFIKLTEEMQTLLQHNKITKSLSNETIQVMHPNKSREKGFFCFF